MLSISNGDQWISCSWCLPFSFKEYHPDKQYLFFHDNKLIISCRSDGHEELWNSLSTAEWTNLPKTPAELREERVEEHKKDTLALDIKERMKESLLIELENKFEETRKKTNFKFNMLLLFAIVFNLIQLYWYW
jgi:hypothetical protein